MGLRFKRIKPISIAVLVAFLTVSLRVDLLAAPKINPQPPVQKKVTSAGQFQDLLKDTEGLLDGMGADLTKRKDVSTKLSQLRQRRSDLQELAGTIRGELATTRAELIAKKLPPEIIQRHDAFAQNFEANLKTLLDNLDGAEHAKQGQLKARIKAVRDHLNKNIYRERHIPLDPNKLPHRRSDFKPRKPITDPKEFKKLFPQISAIPQLAIPIKGQKTSSWDNTLSYLLGIGTAYAQGQVDPNLAETIEVQFTQEIKDLAASLNHDPVKIYNWVRNNIEFIPTYGSIQGAHMTLLTKQGNAFDISSLLIALFRVSNIKARYVYGTIEIPIDKVMNWVGGFADAKSAADFIASGGIPVTAGISGGKITDVWMEHVWVEAWVDYVPSRGGRHKTGQGDTWIPLDASFRQYAYIQGIDIKAAVPFDSETFINQLESTAIIDTANNSVTGVDSLYIQQQFQDYQTRVQDYVNQNYPNATADDIIGKKEIVKQEFPYLLGTLPYKPILIGAKNAEIPNSLRHKVTIQLVNPDFSGDIVFRYDSSLPQLAGKRFTLSYDPATQADNQTLDSYASNYATSIPSYLINLKPVLKIENVIVASGISIGMGNAQTLYVTLSSPQYSEQIAHNLLAGDYAAIGLNPSRINLEFLENRVNKSNFDEPVGETLNQIALSYWTEADTFNKIYAKTMQVNTLRHPSELLVKSKVSISYLFGVPTSATYNCRNIDVKFSHRSVKSLSGDKLKEISYMRQSGIMSSLLEGAIFDQLFSKDIGESVSAAIILKSANEQDLPIYGIDATNLEVTLPLLQVPHVVKSEISDAVNAGLAVTIPKADITHMGWTGVGYIISNPNNGSGAYKISGGLDGGESSVGALTVYPLPQLPATGAVAFLIGHIAMSAGASVVVAEGVIEGILIDTAALSAAWWLTLLILGSIILIYLIVNSLTKEQPRVWRILRHYTTQESLFLIIASAYIKPSDMGELGPGAYLTDYMAIPDNGGEISKQIATVLGIPTPNNPDPNRVTAFIELRIDWNTHGRGFKFQSIRGANQYCYYNKVLLIDGTTVQINNMYP